MIDLNDTEIAANKKTFNVWLTDQEASIKYPIGILNGRKIVIFKPKNNLIDILINKTKYVALILLNIITLGYKGLSTNYDKLNSLLLVGEFRKSFTTCNFKTPLEFTKQIFKLGETYTEDLKDSRETYVANLVSYCSKIQTLQDDVQTLSAETHQLKERISLKDECLRDQERISVELKKRIHELEKEIALIENEDEEAMSQETQAYSEQIAKLNDKIVDLNNQLEILNSQLALQTENNLSIRLRNETLETSSTDQLQEINQLKSQLNDSLAKIKQLNDSNQSLVTRCTNLENEINKNIASYSEVLQKSKLDLENLLGEFLSHQSEYEKQKDVFIGQLAKKDKAIQDLEHSVSQLSTIEKEKAELASQVTCLSKEKESLENTLMQREEELLKMFNENEELILKMNSELVHNS